MTCVAGQDVYLLFVSVSPSTQQNLSIFIKATAHKIRRRISRIYIKFDVQKYVFSA